LVDGARDRRAGASGDARYGHAGRLCGRDCGGLFELVEARLGRALVRECCCSVRFSADERALTGVVRTARSDGMGGSGDAAKSGLEEAIGWAARAVRAAMKMPVGPAPGTRPKGAAGQRASSAPGRIARHRHVR